MDNVERKLRNAGYIGEIKPGQKISPCDDYIMQRGGLAAFFKPGLTAEDIFKHNIISKDLLLVEPEKDIRARLVKGLATTAFELWVCQSVTDAEKYIEQLPRLYYAVVSAMLPEQRGKAPQRLADRVCEGIARKFPDARVIGYTPSAELIGNGYYRLVSRTDVPPEELCQSLVSDAEGGPWLPRPNGGE